MASGSFYKSITGYDYRLIVEWSSTSSMEDNTSVVTATAKLYCPYALYIGARYHNPSDGVTCAMVINGVTYTFNSPAVNTSGGTTHILGSVKSSAIPHNADGSKNVSISCTWSLNATIDGTYYGAQTASGTATLDNIARKVNLTNATNFNDEENPTITYENPVGSLVTKAEVCLSWDNTEITIPYREIDLGETSYTFALTDAERKTLRQGVTGANSRKIYFSVRSTMNGKYYYSSLVKTLTIVNGAPVMVPTVVDVNPVTLALTDNRDTIIRHYSNVQYAFNATALKEATISSYKLVGGGFTATSAAGTLNQVSNGTFTFTVTDSRNNVVTETVEKEFVDYILPTCALDIEAPDAEGNLTFTFDGQYFNGSFGAQNNTLTAQYRYKTGGYGEWTEWTDASSITLSGNTYKATVNLTGLDYTQALTFQAKVSDSLESATSDERTVRTIPVFDWGENDFKFNVPVTAQTDVTVEGELKASGTFVADDVTFADVKVTDSIEVAGPAKFDEKVTFNGGWFTDSNVLLELPSGSYMMDNQEYILYQKVSEQPNGIVLVFSGYDAATGTVKNTSWNTFFVSKYEVLNHPGQGHCFIMVNNSDFLRMGAKYIWIADSSIAGSVSNTLTGTGGSGVKYENNAFVLRYVLGV